MEGGINDKMMQCLSRIDDCISNKNNHTIIAESGLIPILGDLANSDVLKVRWTAAHILAVLSVNDEMKGSLDVLGERENSGQEHWRCGGNAMSQSII